MSAIRLWYLYCDGADCPRRDVGQQPFIIDPKPDETPAWQRAKAAGHGWIYKDGKDYCSGLCAGQRSDIHASGGKP